MFHQPNHSHRSHDDKARSRDGSFRSYALGAVAAGAVLLGVYMLLRLLA